MSYSKKLKRQDVGRGNSKPLYKPRNWRKMHVASFTSGTCLNVQNILEYQLALELSEKEWRLEDRVRQKGCPFQMTECFTLASDSSRAEYLSRKYDVRLTNIPEPPVKGSGNYEQGRWQYDQHMARVLHRRPVDFFFFGGTARSISPPFIRSFKNRIVAVNLGDLRSRDEKGDWLYFGSRSVLKHILTGRKELIVSTYLLAGRHVPGPIIDLSPPISLLYDSELKDVDFEGNARLQSAELDEIAAGYIENKANHPELFLTVQKNVTRAIRQRSHFALARTLLDLSLGQYFLRADGRVLKTNTARSASEAS